MQSSIYLKLLGFLIKKGKKKIAKDILDKALILVSKETRVAPVLVLLKVFSKLNTFIEIKKVNFRKRSHIVPFVIDYERRTYLITKWLFESVKEDVRSISMEEKLSSEIINILVDKHSKTVAKKKMSVKLALRNRSNVHFRW